MKPQVNQHESRLRVADAELNVAPTGAKRSGTWPPQFLLGHGWRLPLGALSWLCFVLLAWEIRGHHVRSIDETLTHWIQSFRGELDVPMLMLTHSGGGWGMTALCVCTVGWMLVLKRHKAATFASVCGIGAWLLTMGLKEIFARARPDVVSHYLIQSPSSFSFPSGHALGSTCVVACLVTIVHALRVSWVWRIGVSCVAATYIIGVAASRVYFGVHYPSDVVGGQLAGTAWVAALSGYFYPRLLTGNSRHSK